MANELFSEDTVYHTSKTTLEEIFDEVAADLLEKGLVNDGFLENLKSRERDYPTAMDMTPLGKDIPNISVPHTEPEFVEGTRLVPIKLEHPVIAHNMIQPTQEVEVGYLFLILNKDPNRQVNILAQIMDFFNRNSEEDLKAFLAMDDPKQIVDFLQGQFR